MTGPAKLWQRNTLAAVVIAAVVAVYVVIDFGPEWSAYRQASTPQTVIAKGDTGTADGQTWRLTSVRHLDRTPVRFAPPLPQGTVLTLVDIDRTGTPPRFLCSAVLTDGERRWDAQSIGGAVPIPPDGISTLCYEPGPVQFAFVVPGDVVPTAVDIMRDGRITARILL
jgi:hypothetical protein